jgi:predicted nucleic acid-binding protein
MKTLRIYIDTSVIGGCFDKEFSTESKAIFDLACKGKAVLVISDLLVRELQNAPKYILDFLESLSEDTIEIVQASVEAEKLHNAYLDAEVVGPASDDDAMHVAIATVEKCDLIVSWNFKHIVHYDKIKGYNGVNLKEGYTLIAIHSPKEVV